MEILDLYDIDGNKIGKTIVRGKERPAANEYIKLCVVYIKCQGKYLYQKCSVAKGGQYAVTGGHVPSGVGSKEQVVVEVQEELGLDIDIDRLRLVGHIVRDIALFDIYYYEDDGIMDYHFTLQESEVESVQWYTKPEIEHLISSGLMRESSAIHYSKFIKDSKEY